MCLKCCVQNFVHFAQGLMGCFNSFSPVGLRCINIKKKKKILIDSLCQHNLCIFYDIALGYPVFEIPVRTEADNKWPGLITFPAYVIYLIIGLTNHFTGPIIFPDLFRTLGIPIILSHLGSCNGLVHLATSHYLGQFGPRSMSPHNHWATMS